MKGHMFSLFIFVFIAIMCLPFAIAENNKPRTINIHNGVHLGMTVEEVIQCEAKKGFQIKEFSTPGMTYYGLMGNGNVYGQENAYIYYSFDNDRKLIQADVIFRKDVFEKLEQALIQKYGETEYSYKTNKSYEDVPINAHRYVFNNDSSAWTERVIKVSDALSVSISHYKDKFIDGVDNLVYTAIPYNNQNNKAGKSDSFSFKELQWGCSRESIIAKEGVPTKTWIDSKTGFENLGYKTKVVGLDAHLFYYIGNNGLYSIRYILDEKHTNNNLYINDFNNLKDSYIKKYGKPNIDTELWDNNSHKKYYSNDKGTALLYGYTSYLAEWDLDDTTIAIIMYSDNYEISTMCGYNSNEAPDTVDYSDEI